MQCIALLASPAWSQVESLQGMDLRGEGKQVAFELSPEVFEKITNHIESTPNHARFFIEDTAGQHHYGTVTHMKIKPGLNRITFSGTLDQSIPLTNKEMRVYLSLSSG